MFEHRINLVERPNCNGQVWDAANLVEQLRVCESADQAKRIVLQSGSEAATLNDLFSISVEANDRFEVLLEVRTSILNRLGYRMASGHIHVLGNVGDQVAYGLRGGVITIEGNSGDFLGAGMRGGLVKVMGNVGHYVGGPSIDSGIGMRGGDILIKGNAGNNVAERMRRGIVFIEGSAGSGWCRPHYCRHYCGFESDCFGVGECDEARNDHLRTTGR